MRGETPPPGMDTPVEMNWIESGRKNFPLISRFFSCQPYIVSALVQELVVVRHPWLRSGNARWHRSTRD
jgi:hypothetical protein